MLSVSRLTISTVASKLCSLAAKFEFGTIKWTLGAYMQHHSEQASAENESSSV